MEAPRLNGTGGIPWPWPWPLRKRTHPVYPLVVNRANSFAVSAIYATKGAALAALSVWGPDGAEEPIFCYVTEVALDDPDAFVYSMDEAVEIRAWNVEELQDGIVTEPPGRKAEPRD